MKDWDTFINRRRGTDYNQDAADDDPPPPYEALPQSEVSISNASPSGSTRRITFSATNQRTSYRRPERALQYYTPHPNHVKCRCGQYNDTTQQSWQLPPGKVRCYCGYIVMASGYSCHPSQDNETCRVQCSCGSLVLNQHHEHQFSCSCGAEFRSDGSVRRLCVYHGTYANDACNVRCTCGKYVDTTAEWTIKHGRSNTGKDRPSMCIYTFMSDLFGRGMTYAKMRTYANRYMLYIVNLKCLLKLQSTSKSATQVREMDEQGKKTLLSTALEHANEAVLRDNAENFEAAVMMYSHACSCLKEVIDQEWDSEDRSKLEAIRDTYSTRIEELQQLATDRQNLSEEAAAGGIDSGVGPKGSEGIFWNPIPPPEKFQSFSTGYLHVDSHQRPFPRFWSKLSIMGLIMTIILLLNMEELAVPWYRTLRLGESDGKEPVTCLPLKSIPPHLRPFQDCSIRNIFRTKLDFLSTARPLCVTEFVSRRNRLAQALVADGFDAFLVEPGYTFQYYANVNQPDWEVWEPEERPFLMVVRPEKVDGAVVANTSFLVPSFEAERARLLDMPFEDEIETVTYEEHWNPYSTLLASASFASSTERSPKIMVDEEMRDFISRGLAENGFDVSGLGGEVERVRQTKSDAEIGILRAVNTGTVEAVRAMRKCLKPGLTEDDVMQVLDNTMRAAGLEPFFDIVLFDEDASNPHGGTDGCKKLENETMLLIDVGAHLYGYSSDICRSFFPPFLPQPKTDGEYAALSDDMKEKLAVWDIVFGAQTASLDALHENSSAADVDIAARKVITDAGYGEAFTHRVGHGIGIKAHESPYLNKGNVNTTLKARMTFTSEPGIYLVDKFGVRHEDVLLVEEDGLPDVLTGRRAQGPWDP